MLASGDRAPALGLLDQDGSKVSLSSFKGRRVLLYFYPKADTPGCTEQTCLLRDISKKIGDVAIVGVSPDAVDKQKKFAVKNKVGFPLLCDTEQVVSLKYGVWQEKSLYGRKFMGIVRSAFLIGPTGRIEEAWYKISPKDTPARLLKALES
jgi:peroxiredoxin Q/BCP